MPHTVIVSLVVIGFNIFLPHIPRLPIEQNVIGSKLNVQENGAWWGANILKITSTEDKIFTYVIDNNTSPQKAFLYSRSRDGVWQEGEAFRVSRPPNIFVDSQGYIHLVGHEPFPDISDDVQGRLFHVKFNQTCIQVWRLIRAIIVVLP